MKSHVWCVLRAMGVNLEAATPRPRNGGSVTLDLGGFDVFYRQHYEGMVRVAYLMVSSRARAEELVQESFLRVHGHWDSLDHPLAYTRRAVVNACNSEHRRRVLEDRDLQRQGQVVIDLDADEMSDALGALADRQRAAIVLRYYADLSEREIAEALDCRPGTVGPLISRGLAHLKEALA